jgi:hypothetical protein
MVLNCCEVLHLHNDFPSFSFLLAPTTCFRITLLFPGKPSPQEMVIFIEVRSHVRLTWLHPQGLGKGYGEPEGGRGRRGGLLAEGQQKAQDGKL